jgi:hypothetical protein
MLRAESTADGVVTVGDLQPSVAVHAVEWQASGVSGSGATPPTFHRSVSDDVVGRATALRLPPGAVVVDGAGTRTRLPPGEESLAEGRYEVLVESVVDVHVAFTGAAVLSRTERAVRLSFPSATTVRVGFSDTARDPPGTVTVPRTPAGMASALSALATTPSTTTAARSQSRMRRHPPLVEFGDDCRIPTRFSPARAASDVRLALPASFDYLFPAASLAYYLGATVDVEKGATPTLSTSNLDRRLDAMPGFQYDVAALLRRVFLLDCLVRGELPDNTPVAESRLLERLPLDPDRLADAPLARRLEAYVDAPFDLISPDLPEWHLSMYIDPAEENVRTLPHLLANLPNVFTPESTPLESDERLRRSLDEFYRADGRSTQQVDPVKPVLGPGRVHGWLADGVPVDVFKTLPEAYEHRSGGADASPTSVVAVLNDAEMSPEHDDAAEIYRRGTADLDIDVSVREQLSRVELARVFEGDHDFVHYVGHCESDGLQCRDGTLSAVELDRSGAETFFLNACGSYHEGIELVSKGSVAGAVTFEKVLDGHAARVGTTFVRLLVNGFSIERALGLARRRIIMGTDYAVVGDGTHRLSGASSGVPLVVELAPLVEGGYQVTFDASSPRITGDVFTMPEPLGAEPHLFGAVSTVTLTAEETERFVRAVDLPVIFDGDIQWSTELEGQLAT